MEIRNNTGALDSLLSQIMKGRNANSTQTPAPAPPPKSPPSVTGQDVVTLSSNSKVNEDGRAQAGLLQQNQTRLSSEKIEDLDNGFRRVQEFENGQGKKFTRIEEFITEDDRSRRTVIQQNESGSTNIIDNILDRQADGTFRLTQKYTDEIGEVQTNIQYNVTPNNADIILGRPPAAEQQNDNPFQQYRGTQFDTQA